MEKATSLTTKDKEAVLKMAGVEVIRTRSGNWRAQDPSNLDLFVATAFYERTVNIAFEELTCPK